MGWCGVERVHDKSRAKGRHLAFGGRGGYEGNKWGSVG